MKVTLATDNANNGVSAPPPAAGGASGSPGAVDAINAADAVASPSAGLDAFQMDLEGVTEGEPIAADASANAPKAEEDAADADAASSGGGGADAADGSHAPGNDAENAESNDVKDGANLEESSSPEVDDDAADVNENEEGGGQPEWVQCDRCEKWRKISDASMLPDQWYCEMNKTDPDRADCAAPEEEWEAEESSSPEVDDDAADAEDAAAPDAKMGSEELKQETVVCREEKEECSQTAGASNAEWVQCDRCEKWRKIPDASMLPDQWYCDMNTSDPDRADCSAPEEEWEDTEGAQETEKCSKEQDPAVPDPPAALPLLVTAGAGAKGNAALAITPPPSHDAAVAAGQSKVVVGMARTGKGGKKKVPKGGVTPSPMPPKGASKGASKKAAKGESKKASKEDKKAASKDDTKKAAPKDAKKPAVSQKALATHAKWQEAAEKIGGPSAKIVVNKADAKKLVFDALHDSFKPMNINGLFAKLKAVVPAVILSSCLDEMVDRDLSNPFADDSDDEDGGKPSKKKGAKKSGGGGGDEYAGSLRVKEGRNKDNTLYYVDHTKLSNNGDGLLPEKRNELLSDLQGARAEVEQLAAQAKQTNAEAAKFESEPKNEELVLELAELEDKEKASQADLETARGHAGNEKRAKLVKKEIEAKGALWRKRKRLTIEFISMMEESTEGTITLKKCLKGDGPIDIDSDEAAIQGAIAYASKPKAKRSRISMGPKGSATNAPSSGVSADPNFIGVRISAKGMPERVYMPGKEE